MADNQDFKGSITKVQNGQKHEKNVVFKGDSNLLAVLLKVIEETQIVLHS